MPISKEHKTNFKTLQRAMKDGAVALMEVTDKATGKPAVLLVIHNHDSGATDGKTEVLTPIARLFEFTEDDNPFELYEPPM